MLLTRANQLCHQAHGGHASLGTRPAIRATASASAIDYAAEVSSGTRAGAREAMRYRKNREEEQDHQQQ